MPHVGRRSHKPHRWLGLGFWLLWALPVQAAEPAQVLGRAIAMGHGPAVETFAARYPLDLNLPLPLHNGLSLRPLSIALTRIQASEQRQLLNHVERLGYLPEYEQQMVERLLRLDAHPVYQEPQLNQKTPLHMVFDLPETQQNLLLRLLLRFQGDGNLDLKDLQGQTPVMYAQSQNPPLGQWLSNYKPSGLSDFQIRQAPFVYAQGLKALERFGHEERLVDAVLQEDPARLQIALAALKSAQSNPDIYLLEPVGRPLLHQAALSPHLEIFRLLLEAGARLTIQDFQGRQLMHLLATQGTPEQIARLSAFKVPLNVQDRQGETPLFYALRAGQKLQAEALLKAGANPQLRNYQGLSARDLLLQQAETDSDLLSLLALV